MRNYIYESRDNFDSFIKFYGKKADAQNNSILKFP